MADFVKQTQKALHEIQSHHRDRACQIYDELKTKQPQSAEDYNCLGVIAFHLNLLNDCLEHYQAAIQIDSKNPSYYNNISLPLMTLGKFNEAESVLNKSRELNPKNIITCYNLGVLYQNRQDLTRAREMFEASVKINSNFANGWAGLASICDKMLDTESARKSAQEALKIDASHPDANSLLADILKREKKYDEALKLLDNTLQKYPHSFKTLYEKGQILHNKKKFDEAYSCFLRANQLQDKKLVTLTDFQKEHDQILSFYQSLEKSHLARKTEMDFHQPVFIVGSPRSGTTLLTQMLDMHSQLQSEGELEIVKQTLNVINSTLNTPSNIKRIYEALWYQLDEETICKFRNDFINRVKNLKGTQQGLRVIDKLPSNARRLGLIAKIAPGAPVIHMIRDGREVAFSAFTQNFKNYMWHSHDLKNAIHEWLSTITLARAGAKATQIPYLEIRYEELVQNPKEILQKVLSFLNLEWEENCLNFSQSKTLVHTASYQQVRQDVYQTSLSKAKNYTKQYAEMTELAREMLEELGYQLNEKSSPL